MKRSSPLWGSVSVLIGVVIAILALVRGAWLVPLLLLTFTAWGLWVVMFQLQPAWDSIRGYPSLTKTRKNMKINHGLISGVGGAFDGCPFQEQFKKLIYRQIRLSDT